MNTPDNVGTWSGVANAVVINDLDIAGNVTISGTVYFNTKTLTYVSAAVTTTGSNLTLSGACALNTNGMSWNNVTISALGTYTINSLLTATGTLTILGGVQPTFAGSSGFTVGTLTAQHATAVNVFLKHSITYTVTTALDASLGRVGACTVFTSDDASIKAILTANNGATCNVLANFTRIDASAGRTIYSFNGTITNCININSFADLKTISRTFVQ